jgi:hypothetical protein
MRNDTPIIVNKLGNKGTVFFFIFSYIVIVDDFDLQVLRDLRAFCSAKHEVVAVRMRLCVASARTVGRIWFIFHISEFIRHRLMPGDYVHCTSLKNKTAIFLKIDLFKYYKI